MRIIITTAFLLLNIKLFACSCLFPPAFKNKEDLKEYTFIALVSIKQTAPLDSANRYMHLRLNGDIKISILEQFKGPAIDIVFDSSYNNDCNLNVETGEQWLFFGYTQNGKTYISRCSYTVRYKTVNGFREWNYFTGIEQLDVLRRIYEHKAFSTISDKVFYPDGKIEIKQKITDGKLNGKRSIFYPNGNIFIAEDFKKGVRAGYRRIYDTSGHMLQSTKYERGIKKEVINYQDTAENVWYIKYQIKNHNEPLFGEKEHDSAYFVKLLDSLRSLKHWDKEIRSSYIYSNDGLSYKYLSYGYKGNLEGEGYQDWKTKINERRNYYKSGKLQTYIRYDQINDKQIEYDYKEDGSKKEFINNCESCKYYFDSNNPPAAPEKTYIQ
jgi:hypothetical protein